MEQCKSQWGLKSNTNSVFQGGRRYLQPSVWVQKAHGEACIVLELPVCHCKETQCAEMKPSNTPVRALMGVMLREKK